MYPKFFNLKCYACLILIEDNKILLIERSNTGYSDGLWALPGGTMEDFETPDQVVVREIKEEINVDINYTDLSLAHTLFHFSNNEMIKIGYYFLASDWAGKILNLEPDKHSDVQWFDFDALPTNLSQVSLQAIIGYKNKYKFSFMDV